MRMKFICNFLGKLIIQLAAKKAYYANQQNWFIVLFCIFSFILKCRKKNIIVYNDNTIQQKKKTHFISSTHSIFIPNIWWQITYLSKSGRHWNGLNGELDSVEFWQHKGSTTHWTINTSEISIERSNDGREPLDCFLLLLLMQQII